MTIRITTVLAALTSLFVLLTPARASTLLWTFDAPVVLKSNATIDGSFIYDADSNVFSNVNITLTGSSSGNDGLYDEVLSSSGTDPLFTIDPPPGDYTGVTVLDLQLTGSMTNAGGSIDIFSAYISTCDDASCTRLTPDPNDSIDLINVGYVGTITASPVPAPAAAWLFGSGLLGLIGVTRRNNKNKFLAGEGK